jgi:hypothetical protein
MEFASVKLTSFFDTHGKLRSKRFEMAMLFGNVALTRLRFSSVTGGNSNPRSGAKLRH